MKQKWIELPGEIDKSTITISVRFQYPSSTTDRMSRQEISKDIEGLNNIKLTNLT